MEVPVGLINLISSLGSIIRFLPFFFILLVLGLVKAVVFGPVVASILFIGNSSVVVALWPAHLFWTYYATNQKDWTSFENLLLAFLRVPLILWLIFSIVGSALVGIGYGFFSPLTATLQAVGERPTVRLYHCLVDGSWSSIKKSCTLVRDFRDLCFHSYFSLMDDVLKDIRDEDQPFDIKLSRVPGAFLVSLLGVIVDVPLVTLVALSKSPYMLLRGWQRFLQDLIGREGPFVESVCVPFAGLAIILWPIAVVFSFLGAVFSSFFIGLYGAVIVHQEDSVRMGLAYIVSAVALFDEYTNDLLYLREGSRLPRPKYRKNTETHSGPLERSLDMHGHESMSENGSRLKRSSTRVRSRNPKDVEITPVQLWDWLFQSCETMGRTLFQNDLITMLDIERCFHKGRCKKLTIRLPAYCILQCLVRSANSSTSGLHLSDEKEVNLFNSSRDRFLNDWFLKPLLIMKDQLKVLQLHDNELLSLSNLIMNCDSEKLEDWDYDSFPCDDNVRKAQLQAIVRRLQGIVASLSRIPTFRRRFHHLIRTLYLEATGGTCLRGEVPQPKNDVQKNSADSNIGQSEEVEAVV